MDYNAILENLDSIPLEILKKINNYYQNKYNKTINYDFKAHNAQYHEKMKNDIHYKEQKAEYAKKQNAKLKANRPPRVLLTEAEKAERKIIAYNKFNSKKTQHQIEIKNIIL